MENVVISINQDMDKTAAISKIAEMWGCTYEYAEQLIEEMKQELKKEGNMPLEFSKVFEKQIQENFIRRVCDLYYSNYTVEDAITKAKEELNIPDFKVNSWIKEIKTKIAV